MSQEDLFQVFLRGYEERQQQRAAAQSHHSSRHTTNQFPSIEAFNQLIKGVVSKKQFNNDRVNEFGLNKQFINLAKGLGVKNSKFIPKGAIVLIFDGEYRTSPETYKLERQYAHENRRCYMLYLQATVSIIGSNGQRVQVKAIDPTIRTQKSIEEYSLGRYMNDAKQHSDECNIDVFGKIRDDHKEFYFVMKATKDIAPNTELCFDYGDHVPGNLSWREDESQSQKPSSTYCNLVESKRSILSSPLNNNSDNRQTDTNTDINIDYEHESNYAGHDINSQEYLEETIMLNLNGSSSTSSVSSGTQSTENESQKEKNKTSTSLKRKREERITKKLNSTTEFISEAEFCCRQFKCSKQTDTFTPIAISDCRNELYSIETSTDQREYIRRLQRVDYNGRSYPTVLNANVCQQFFCFVYKISSNRLNRIRDGTKYATIQDKPAMKEQSVIRWLDDFAAFHEVMPNSELIQLPYSKRKIVFDLYSEDQKEQCNDYSEVSESFFMKVWREKRNHLVLRKHLKFTICDTCEQLRIRYNASVDMQIVQRQKEQLREHLEFIKQERLIYEKKKIKAQDPAQDVLSLVLDGADQSAYGMPYFATPTKTSVKGWKQRYHLIGVIEHSGSCYLYTCTDKWAHGSNLTIEVLQRTLMDLAEGKFKGRRLPSTLYLQLDNCWRENKNKYLLGYLSWLVMRQVFHQIEVGFLPVGHTHTDIDQLWSRTAVALHGSDARSRDELFEVCKRSYHPTPKCEHIQVTANFNTWVDEEKYLNHITHHTEPRYFKICPRVSYGEDDKLNDSYHNDCNNNNNNNNNSNANNNSNYSNRKPVTNNFFQMESSSDNTNTQLIQPVLWTKMESTDQWSDSNVKGGFPLLKASTIPKRIIPGKKCKKPPPAVPKECDPEVFKKLQTGLEASKSRLTDTQYQQNLEDLEDLNNPNPIEFHWRHYGTFPSETQQERKGGLRSADNNNTENDDEKEIPLEDLQKGKLLSHSSQKLGPLDKRFLKEMDFVVVGAGEGAKANEKFWVAQVHKQYETSTFIKKLRIQWYEAADTAEEFGRYYPSLEMPSGKPFFDDIDLLTVYLRFDSLTKSKRLPALVIDTIRNYTELLEKRDEEIS